VIVAACALLVSVSSPVGGAAAGVYTAPDGTQIAFGDATIKSPDDVEVPVTCVASPTGRCLIPTNPEGPGSRPRYSGIYRWPNPDFASRTLDIKGRSLSSRMRHSRVEFSEQPPRCWVC
jgi:hypothetical protein